ncbi:MAG: integration host factor subunit beta [Syntrophales bacterium]|jgi:integration host factor subunit beta|nr:integration host factor subunit beta [Syntrophales bacterium]MDY0044495.1 HU family DNA-binding protein [Syntrophales bacterium]
MTKSELVEEMKKRMNDFSKNDMASAVDIVFETMKQSMARGERIELRGFGVFTVKERKPRKGRNPKTGMSVAVPARRAAGFKIGKELKRMVEK